MINKKRILNSDIRYACGDTYFARGRQYFDEGRVSGLRVVQEKPFIVIFISKILGSKGNNYKQNIRIDWKDDYSTVEVDGDCSCPMSYNCKHIAAACLEYMHLLAEEVSSNSDDHACLDWLNEFDSKLEAQDSNKEFIAYILKSNKLLSGFSMGFAITNVKKMGGLSKGRKTTVNNIRYSYSYNNYIQEIDQEIARLLYTLETNYAGEPQISGTLGSLALSKIIQTGRLFWETHQSNPLQMGEERAIQFSWEQQNNKEHTLSINIEPEASLILTDPPLYFDNLQRKLGDIKGLNISHEQLKKIIAIPAIPTEHVEEFSQRLVLEYPTIPLPSPKPVTVTELFDLLPIPKITLFGASVSASDYCHFIRLNFVYDGKTISAHTSEAIGTAKTKQGFYRIHRNIELESEAIKQLQALGFNMTDIIANKELTFISPVESSLSDSAGRWSDFIKNTLPLLREQGWIVEQQDNFKLNFQTADDWQANIKENGNDWFEMNFQVNINGQPMPLLPLIMPVLQDYTLEELPEMLSVPIDEHSYIDFPSSQLRPFLEIVYELFDGLGINANGSLSLSRFNAAALADLETHSYGVFSLNGGKELIETGKKIKNFKGLENVPIPTGLNATLRDYQQEGLNWLQFLREYNFSGILADDMGLGKTVQALSHLQLEKESGRMIGPCLIIAPTSLMGNWRREAERFTPQLKVLTLQGAERKQYFDQIKEHDLILTTYPLLPRDQDILLESDYYYLILDEAQVIKNPRAQAAQVVRKIKCQHRLCLTGTPMENHLGELWAQFDFLMPGFLGDSAFFKKIYRTPIEIHGDDQQRERLSKRLKPFMLRRTKQEVATELPAKTEIIRSVPLYDKQATLYESIRISMEKKVRDAIADKGLARSHITILDALLKLRQTCCDPRTLPLEKAKKVTESAKLDLLMEMLPEQLEEGRRILVFSQFTKMIALMEIELKARKIEYSKLTGQTKKRDEAIDRFKSGEADVFLISLKAGGVGLNLTEADTVIIYDPWWNPAVETQAADRAHRIGQDKPVFVYKLMTDNTVEEKILAMQEKKRALADSIYQGGKKDQSAQFTANDLSELFKPLS